MTTRTASFVIAGLVCASLLAVGMAQSKHDDADEMGGYKKNWYCNTCLAAGPCTQPSDAAAGKAAHKAANPSHDVRTGICVAWTPVPSDVQDASGSSVKESKSKLTGKGEVKADDAKSHLKLNSSDDAMHNVSVYVTHDDDQRQIGCVVERRIAGQATYQITQRFILPSEHRFIDFHGPSTNAQYEIVSAWYE